MSNETIQPLEFEKPLIAIEEKIQELIELDENTESSFQKEIDQLKKQAQEIKNKLYKNLKPSQSLQIARHPQRPNLMDLIHGLSDTWFELRGDRGGTDDRAILGGIIELKNKPVLIVGTQKGHDMKANLVHNFGMANPEGYRKALRLFQHAEKFKMPVITVVDTPGAYPGIDGEQHGIGQAIAMNIREMARLRVPIISLVTGEGASGGALGIGVANRIYMMEHSVYTVISPEGCASILWRSAEFASTASEALKIRSHDLKGFGMIDGVIEEPLGGAHKDCEATFESIQKQLNKGISELSSMSPEELIEDRYNKFRAIGAFEEAVEA